MENPIKKALENIQNQKPIDLSNAQFIGKDGKITIPTELGDKNINHIIREKIYLDGQPDTEMEDREEEEIGKLTHQQEMLGKIIEKHIELFETLQKAADRQFNLKRKIDILKEAGREETDEYKNTYNQYINETGRNERLIAQAETEDGNLVEINEKIIELEEQIKSRERILHGENYEMN